ncbi:glycoside hydrolase family 3 C-terminal domain-containing protein [Streptomyces sp. NBC_01474]|uniref:glycoside hydrolase family 3 C-terminal domain-containing protein n=1 Tax=unclassified Streptomyces TaxID=2593676 RepID=UPI002DDA9798|nr:MULTISPECIES: glycoside hydrolase family 3 C-terminal domain-containing protein [unclassified Streptomyces]WSD94675.1 glycoside hydrolase family 3 C-terminal domain-containing protein [Streptomyces sp. NBC_01474]
MTDAPKPISATPGAAQEATARLTLDEKAALTTGASWWATGAFPHAGIPEMRLSDGPHGLRLQDDERADHLGINGSAPATCFPPAVTLASSWDADLAERVGRALGRECLAHGVHVLLGPGINIKRSPLCGRNFEYFSEDPFLSGVLGTAWVKGLQAQGVGASLKHFAANNQENGRMSVSSDIDPRALREIYLPAFHRVVTEARPWTVMCAYNRLNGVHSSENHWLLTDLLRDEWGYEGVVVSDWGAVLDRARSLAAGLDLEMPSSSGLGPARLVDAVNSGELDEKTLDVSAARVAELALKTMAHADPDADYDRDAHHALAREAATRGAVLLKNDNELLPLDPRADTRIAVLGEFARTPRYQGAGSSKVTPTQLDDALTALALAAPSARIDFAPGFPVDDPEGDLAALREEAVRTARAADVVLLFLGLPPSFESEGYDRDHLELPAEQTELLAAVTEANPNTVVILANGGVVRLADWIDRVPAVLEGWLLGQAGGTATADLLFGTANPSGRLAETIPLRLADTPAFADWPGERGHARYGEGIFVGYRHYDTRDLEVSYPFGHGLSYTTFEYTNLRVTQGDAGLDVTVSITNTGPRAGHEVVQAYTRAPGSQMRRPVRELRAFAAVPLAPAETRDVTLHIARADLAHFDIGADAWLVEGLDYGIEVGASSRDIRVTTSVTIDGDRPADALSADSTIGEWRAHPVGGPAVERLLDRVRKAMGDAYPQEGSPRYRMITGMRLSQLAKLPIVPLGFDDIEALLAVVRHEPVRSLRDA